MTSFVLSIYSRRLFRSLWSLWKHQGLPGLQDHGLPRVCGGDCSLHDQRGRSGHERPAPRACAQPLGELPGPARARDKCSGRCQLADVDHGAEGHDGRTLCGAHRACHTDDNQAAVPSHSADSSARLAR